MVSLRQHGFLVICAFVRLDIQFSHLLTRLTTVYTTAASACGFAMFLMIFIHVFMLVTDNGAQSTVSKFAVAVA